MNFKFIWNGIKVDKKLYRAWYSDGELKNYPVGTITIYAKEYYHPPMPIIEGLQIHNDSDSMTDYFEHDRIRVEPINKHYQDVLAAQKLQEIHDKKRYDKKYGKKSTYKESEA